MLTTMSVIGKAELFRRLGDPVRPGPDGRGEVMTARPPKFWTASKIRSSSVATAAKVTLFALNTRS